MKATDTGSNMSKELVVNRLSMRMHPQLNRHCPIVKQLLSEIKDTPRYGAFLRTNSAKIEKKLRGAKQLADQCDVLAELYFARAVLREKQVELDYEPLANGPDFRICMPEQFRFMTEIRRIRLSDVEIRLERLLHEIVQAARTVRSSLGMSVAFLPDSEIAHAVDRIDHQLASIKIRLVEQIQRCCSELQVEQVYVWQPDGLEGILEVRLERSEGRSADTPTANFGGVHQIPFDMREWRKCSDIICDKVRQMVDGIANVLVIYNDSDRIDDDDLRDAIESVIARIVQRDDDFFRRKQFADWQTFFAGFRKLSAVVFRGDGRPYSSESQTNFVWRNEYAHIAIPETVVETLRDMG